MMRCREEALGSARNSSNGNRNERSGRDGTREGSSSGGRDRARRQVSRGASRRPGQVRLRNNLIAGVRRWEQAKFLVGVTRVRRFGRACNQDASAVAIQGTKQDRRKLPYRCSPAQHDAQAAGPCGVCGRGRSCLSMCRCEARCAADALPCPRDDVVSHCSICGRG